MASTVFFATTRSGFKIAILGNCADASCKARTERFIPGAIIPPSKSLSFEIISKVVAVPLSTINRLPSYFCNAPNAVTNLSEPTSFGLSISIATPISIPSSPTTIGSTFKCRLARFRILKSD